MKITSKLITNFYRHQKSSFFIFFLPLLLLTGCPFLPPECAEYGCGLLGAVGTDSGDIGSTDIRGILYERLPEGDVVKCSYDDQELLLGMWVGSVMQVVDPFEPMRIVSYPFTALGEIHCGEYFSTNLATKLSYSGFEKTLRMEMPSKDALKYDVLYLRTEPFEDIHGTLLPFIFLGDMVWKFVASHPVRINLVDEWGTIKYYYEGEFEFMLFGLKSEETVRKEGPL